MESEKEKEVILAKLELLDHMLKLHNWTNFDQEEAELEEELEEKLDEKSDIKKDRS